MAHFSNPNPPSKAGPMPSFEKIIPSAGCEAVPNMVLRHGHFLAQTIWHSIESLVL